MKTCGRVIVLLALAVVGLSGCGFHLAGDRPLPPPLASVYIEVISPYGVAEPPLQSALQKRIERRGGIVRSRSDQAAAILRLSDLAEIQDTVAIGPDGKAVEYRLVERVRYELDGGGKVAVAPDTLTVSRDYSFNAQQILAKEAEQSRLREYLQDQMAELLLLRLEASLRLNDAN